MSGNLPGGCTQADIDRAIEEREEPIAEGDLAKTCARCGAGPGVPCHCYASEPTAAQVAALKPSPPETPREVFEALLSDWTDLEAAERATDLRVEKAEKARTVANAKAADWLARYDAAVQAIGG